MTDETKPETEPVADDHIVVPRDHLIRLIAASQATTSTPDDRYWEVLASILPKAFTQVEASREHTEDPDTFQARRNQIIDRARVFAQAVVGREMNERKKLAEKRQAATAEA